MAATAPSASTITPAQFTDLLALYPAALSAAYDAKIADGKKRAQALEDDAWRYGELPTAVTERKGKEKCLQKAELERLVGWKM